MTGIFFGLAARWLTKGEPTDTMHKSNSDEAEVEAEPAKAEAKAEAVITTAWNAEGAKTLARIPRRG